MTLASRLSTVGRDVLDGNGLAVSVNVSVGVTEAVSVGPGTKGVSVTGANDVFAGTMVSTTTGGMGVDVSVQAMDVMMHKIGKLSVRLMCEIGSPFEDTQYFTKATGVPENRGVSCAHTPVFGLLLIVIVIYRFCARLAPNDPQMVESVSTSGASPY